MTVATELVNETDERVLDHALELLPEGVDLTNEDEFIQAGVLLVDQINVARIALGELLEWKMWREHATDDESRDVIFARYAHAWGTSRTSLVKAWVLATKFPEVPRPEDVASTTAYEVLSGSATEQEAQAGMQAVAEYGLGVEKVREAKQLQARGLNKPGEWTVPYLFYRDGDIWARSSDGDEIRVWRADNRDNETAQKAHEVSRRRLHV